MPLTREQIEGINVANRDRVTRALQHLAGAKSSGSHVDSPDIRELEAALRARLAQLDNVEDRRRVSEIVEGAIAIIDEEDPSDPGALPKTNP
jgi:hypothetical protein